MRPTPTARLSNMADTENAQTLQRETIDWILRLESADCTAANRQAFQTWLTQSEDRQRIYQQLAETWSGLSRFQGQDFPVRREALSYRPPRKTTRRFIELAVAASLLLGVGVATFSEQGWHGQTRHYATERGGRQTVSLADGSSIELSTDTELKIRVNRWQRSVELIKGEAFFQVVHDQQRPFEVKAGSGKIIDIGTQFDVRLDNEHVAVAVLEGIVQVQAGDSREIHANQAISYDDRGELQTSAADDINAVTAWRRGQLVFENRRLDEVLAELQRFHDISLTLAEPALAKLKVTGTFHTDNLDATLNIIAMTLPVDIRRHNPKQVVLLKR